MYEILRYEKFLPDIISLQCIIIVRYTRMNYYEWQYDDDKIGFLWQKSSFIRLLFKHSQNNEIEMWNLNRLNAEWAISFYWPLISINNFVFSISTFQEYLKSKFEIFRSLSYSALSDLTSFLTSLCTFH